MLSPRRRSKVLVTGGAGFIGGHLVAKLAENYEVRVIDRASCQERVNSVEYLLGDVRNLEEVLKASDGVQAVIHLAALVSVPLCEEHPKESYQTNLMGTLHVLEAARQARSKGKSIRVIFSSSSAVYGDTSTHLLGCDEERHSPNPISLYGMQKWLSELAIQRYVALYEIPAVIFRFFNVYGPGQKSSSPYSGVISRFMESALKNAPVTVYGTGDQTRDFVFVGDIVRAIALALETPHANGMPINLGTGESVSISELAKQLGSFSKFSQQILHTEARPNDVLHSRAVIEKAKGLLSWTPQVGLSEGLQLLYGRASSNNSQ